MGGSPISFNWRVNMTTHQVDTIYRTKPSKADTNVRIPGTRRVLQITTRKWDNGNLVTTASVHSLSGAFAVTLIGEDFYQRLATSQLRATPSAVRRQHDECLADVDALLDQVMQFYAARDAKEAEKAKADAADQPLIPQTELGQAA